MISGLHTLCIASHLNAIYYIMCFEFEIPNKKKDKNLNMIDAEFEVEPELKKYKNQLLCQPSCYLDYKEIYLCYTKHQHTFGSLSRVFIVPLYKLLHVYLDYREIYSEGA